MQRSVTSQRRIVGHGLPGTGGAWLPGRIGMRFCTSFLLVALLAAPAAAQSELSLDKRVTKGFKNTSLRLVLDDLRSEAAVNLLADPQHHLKSIPTVLTTKNNIPQT